MTWRVWEYVWLWRVLVLVVPAGVLLAWALCVTCSRGDRDEYVQ